MFKLDMKKKKLSHKLETHSPNARHTTIEKKRDTDHTHVEAEKRAKKKLRSIAHT